MFPSLDSPLEVLQRAQDFWESAAFWGLMLVGVVVAVCGPALSTYRTKLEDKIKELKSAAASQAANDRANSLEEKLTKANEALVNLARTSQDISAKVTNRVSMLTPEVRSRIVERLKKLPAKSVGFVSAGNSPEAKDFGEAIEQLLRESGCLTPSNIQVSGMSVSGDIPTGDLVIQWIVAEGKPVAAELAAAFKDAGVPGVVLSDSRAFAFATGKLAQVTVGLK